MSSRTTRANSFLLAEMTSSVSAIDVGPSRADAENEDLLHPFDKGGPVGTLVVGFSARFSLKTTSSGWVSSCLLFPRPVAAANAVAVSITFDKADVSCCVVSKGRADDACGSGVVAGGVNAGPTPTHWNTGETSVGVHALAVEPAVASGGVGLGS